MSLLRLLSALLCLSAFPAVSAELDLIQNASARQGVNLNGLWRAIVDPYESGYFAFRTTHSHIEFRRFRVYRLVKTP